MIELRTPHGLRISVSATPPEDPFPRFTAS